MPTPESTPTHIHHGQPYASVDFFPQSGTLDLASALSPHEYCALHWSVIHNTPPPPPFSVTPLPPSHPRFFGGFVGFTCGFRRGWGGGDMRGWVAQLPILLPGLLSPGIPCSSGPHDPEIWIVPRSRTCSEGSGSFWNVHRQYIRRSGLPFLYECARTYTIFIIISKSREFYTHCWKIW